MTLEMKTIILGICAGGLAVVLETLPRPRPSSRASGTPPFPGRVALALAIVAAALIAVGVVSGTLPSHLVQISPLVLVLALLGPAPRLGSVAAGAVLSFWLVTMVGIWLYLLGLSRFLTGTFSPTEIALTVVIGVASLGGLTASGRVGDLPLTARVPAIVLGAGIQALALWISYQPLVTGR